MVMRLLIGRLLREEGGEQGEHRRNTIVKTRSWKALGWAFYYIHKVWKDNMEGSDRRAAGFQQQEGKKDAGRVVFVVGGGYRKKPD